MHDPDDTFLPSYDGLSGLASREAQGAIPSHYALSLSDLKQPTTPEPTKNHVERVERVRVAPSDDVETFKELIPRITATLRRIASRGESADHAQLEALAGRLSNLDFVEDEILKKVAELRRQADSWRTIANKLTELAKNDARFKPARADSWSAYAVQCYAGARSPRAAKKTAKLEASAHIIDVIEVDRKGGATWQSIATKLNDLAESEERYKPPRGGLWSRATLSNFYKRTIAQR